MKKCGCYVYVDAADGPIKYCPLHAAAGELLAMLKTVHFEGAGMHYDAIASLIAKAQGKP